MVTHALTEATSGLSTGAIAGISIAPCPLIMMTILLLPSANTMIEKLIFYFYIKCKLGFSNIPFLSVVVYCMEEHIHPLAAP